MTSPSASELKRQISLKAHQLRLERVYCKKLFQQHRSQVDYVHKLKMERRALVEQLKRLDG